MPLQHHHHTDAQPLGVADREPEGDWQPRTVRRPTSTNGGLLSAVLSSTTEGFSSLLGSWKWSHVLIAALVLLLLFLPAMMLNGRLGQLETELAMAQSRSVAMVSVHEFSTNIADCKLLVSHP